MIDDFVTHPLISVVMPTYNGEEHLREQFDSLLDQSYPNFEIVVVDDNSTDGTNDILADYAKRCPNIFVHRNANNLGVSGNFEKGMRLASGDLIALADQDDVWAPEKLSVLTEHIDDHTMIFADSILVDDKGRLLGQTLHQRLKINPVHGNEDRAFYFSNCVPGHAMLFRRALLDFALPLPTHTLYDQWLAFVACRMNGIAYLPRPLVRYRQHVNSIMNIHRINKFKKRGLFELRAYREGKIARRTEAAHNRSLSLQEFAESPITRADDQNLLKSMAIAYQRFDSVYLNIPLLKSLYKNREDFFRITNRPAINSCLREALGGKYLKLFPFT